MTPTQSHPLQTNPAANRPALRKPALWFRSAAVLLLLFAVGHTVGFLTFRPPNPEGRAVWNAMNSVTFSDGHSNFTYGGFYVGFGIFVSVFLLFSGWLSWMLAAIARRSPADARILAWGLAATQLINLVLCLRYFAVPPAVFSALTVACLILGASLTPHSSDPLDAA
jgi:hypothetical protein